MRARLAMLPSRLRYYLTSIPTLLAGVRNPSVLLALLLRRTSSRSRLYLRNGLVFQVRTAMDAWVIKETCLDGDYEPRGFEIQPDWLIVDLGAGLGEFAVAAAKKSPRGAVYAYEPFADSFELLTENIRLNRVGNVEAFPYAVGASASPMHLNLGTGVPVLHSTVANASDGPGPVVSVKGTSLDEVFQVHSIERCDLLKIDCEGAEFDILFNAHPHTLARINRICLEYHNGATPFSHPDLVRFLERGDFKVTVRPSPVHAHTGLLYAIK